MTVSPSQVFEFLASTAECNIERYEVRQPSFSALRRSLGVIVLSLRETEDQDAIEVSDALRVHLSEWLTVPIPFDKRLHDWTPLLGDPRHIERRWGSEVREAHDVAVEAARELQHVENPVRAELREILLDLSGGGHRWRIYCHRRARGCFETLGHDLDWSADVFLHSVTDYRDTAPFDALIKVGPLRSRGWGAAPDALLSAPRFARLIQLVWSGSADEDGFGLDPVCGTIRVATGSTPALQNPSGVRWSRRTIPTGDASGPVATDVPFDELKLFNEINRGAALRRGVLIDVGEDHGILLPPNAHVASFDPYANRDESPFEVRVPGETLAPGMFLIRARLGDLDLGGVHAADGQHSRVWKKRLEDELCRDGVGLVQRLRAAGLNLQHLGSRARRWCKPPTTVIHAPQQKKHFEVLISVLGIDHAPSSPAAAKRRPWWRYAWSEIAHSRGEAIQSGMQEQEIIDEELFSLLKAHFPQIRESASVAGNFRFDIPEGGSLRGVVDFYAVRSIEDGFLAPDHAMRQITELEALEQWRA